MQLDWTAISIILSNLGALALIGKWIVSGVVKSNENLPIMIKSIETLTKSVEELYQSRNKHDIWLTEITTGIAHCDACNEYKHRRAGDKTSTVTHARKSERKEV